MKTRDRYLKIVEWSEEDQCYVGTCPSLMLGGVHGEDEAEVSSGALRSCGGAGWRSTKRTENPSAGDPGKEYSGKFVLRVGKELHKDLAIKALRCGESLNSYCVDVLRERTSEYESSKTRD